MGTTTTNLSLYKPAAAETGWHDLVNANFDTLDENTPRVNVMTHGATGDGSTDDTAAIQAAIDACNTGGGGIVWFPPGTFRVDGTLSLVNKSNVMLVGSGYNPDPFTAGALPAIGTILKRVSGTGTMLTFGSNATGPLKGQGLQDINVDGNNLAATGVLITSSYGGLWRRVHIRNCTTVALDVTTFNGDGLGTQYNLFENITVHQITAASGIGMRFDSTTDGDGNVSNNLFQNLTVRHKNGVAIQWLDSDSNMVSRVNVSRDAAGTAIGVELGASNTAFMGHCRANNFSNLNPGAGGLTARATGFSQPSRNNVVVMYLTENGPPLPTIESGASLAYWTDSGNVRMDGSDDKFGFGLTPVAKQTVSGAKGGNVALASLLTALVNYGLITDSTSA